MRPALVERDPGPHDEVLDRAGYQDLAGPRVAGHPGTDMYRDPVEIRAPRPALTSVQARAYLNPKAPRGLNDGPSAVNRSSGPVERGEETIAQVFDLPASEAPELMSHDYVVAPQ